MRSRILYLISLLCLIALTSRAYALPLPAVSFAQRCMQMGDASFVGSAVVHGDPLWTEGLKLQLTPTWESQREAALMMGFSGVMMVDSAASLATLGAERLAVAGVISEGAAAAQIAAGAEVFAVTGPLGLSYLVGMGGRWMIVAASDEYARFHLDCMKKEGEHLREMGFLCNRSLDEIRREDQKQVQEMIKNKEIDKSLAPYVIAAAMTRIAQERPKCVDEMREALGRGDCSWLSQEWQRMRCTSILSIMCSDMPLTERGGFSGEVLTRKGRVKNNLDDAFGSGGYTVNCGVPMAKPPTPSYIPHDSPYQFGKPQPF